jgi:uncharacterized protein
MLLRQRPQMPKKVNATESMLAKEKASVAVPDTVVPETMRAKVRAGSVFPKPIAMPKRANLNAKMSGFIGVGLRPTHYSFLESHLKDHSTELSAKWFEAISENYMDTEGRPLQMLEKIRGHFPVALHGVSLSIGSTDEISEKYLKRLTALVERIDPFIVSDHLCWTGAQGRNLHDLLPLPFTKECLSHLCDRIALVQTRLKREIVLENVSSYLRYRENDWTEWEFLNQVSHKTGSKILLDINNVYVNSVNHSFDPYEYIDGIQMENVRQIHLAGFTDMGDFLFDTHSKPVHPPVWELFAHAISKKSDIPVLIEWDEDIPSFELLEDEVRRADAIVAASSRPRIVKDPS